MATTEWATCTCGGGASVTLEPEDKSVVCECACGKRFVWNRGDVCSTIVPPDVTNPDPPTLGISVSDSAKAQDRFGG